jgi:DNA-binding IclR family transcriptional regulator
MELTVLMMLSSMEAARAYTLTELAEQFGTSAAEVREMLCQLVEEGKVRMSSDASRTIWFERLFPVTVDFRG